MSSLDNTGSRNYAKLAAGASQENLRVKSLVLLTVFGPLLIDLGEHVWIGEGSLKLLKLGSLTVPQGWVVSQDATGGEYTQYGNMLMTLAAHEAHDLNVTVYKQIWNEPDLTSYFNYSAGGTTFFHGTNSDYNNMYAAASTAMAVNVFPLSSARTGITCLVRACY